MQRACSLQPDSKQSLYSRNYTWSSAHPRLQFKGRSATLRRNYRSTKEIDDAAFSLLVPHDGDVPERSSIRHLPLDGVGPCLRICKRSPNEHTQTLATASWPQFENRVAAVH